ncbi:MAG TPA: hypothetical protein PL078_06250 [Bacillota bacterium]|nr:hypothetical protein [Bacillota bacterium]HQD75991.1 hypothetical protein [Bacillota bacterium]HUM58320.1 hypothetical protein [Bacillota bacterium]
MKQKTVLCTRGYTGPRLAGRLARRLDRLITACQEWLEGPDRPAARLVALAVIFASFFYIGIRLVLRLVRGG